MFYPLVELPSRLDGQGFLEFLQNEFADLLMELPLSYRQNMWLQLDGAPPHFARAVREYLNANHEPWIGRGGIIAWPARSPDLTPLDYFLWGDEIKNDVEMVRRSSRQIALRATVCLQNNGGHFEQQLC